MPSPCCWNATDQSVGAVVVVTLLKRQELLAPSFTMTVAFGRHLLPESSLWSDCPGLHQAWFGMPPWHDRPHQPESSLNGSVHSDAVSGVSSVVLRSASCRRSRTFGVRQQTGGKGSAC